MFKSILVGIDASEHSQHAQALAFYLGRRLQASILALHVVDLLAFERPLVDDISDHGNFEPYLEGARTRETLTEHGRELIAAFKESAASQGVTAETALDYGLIGERLCEHSRSADLTLLGRPGPGAEPELPALGKTTDTVARKSPNTVVICPRQVKEIAHIALAYDGSDRACRAMHSAAAMASALRARLTVVTVGRDDRAERILGEARKYFAAYKLDADFKVLGGPVGQRLVELVSGLSADVLYLGAHGRSRIHEMILGSTTEFVLRHAPCPMFLCH